MRRLGEEMIPCVFLKGNETEARLWEIAENLHRADLSVQERADYVAEWVRLTDENLQSAQVARIESKREDGRGHRAESGLSAVTRDLGIERTEAQRAIKIAGLAPEVKEAAAEAGLTTQSALLRVAAEPSAELQLARIREEERRAEGHKENQKTDRAIALIAAEEFSTWLLERTDVSQLPTLISWLEGTKAKDVIAALRRESH